MKKVSRKVAALGIGTLAMIVGAGTASAAQITIGSTVAQSGHADFTLANTPLTDPAAPYDFAGMDYSSLVSIDSITITLTVQDGDTATGELDFDNWTLGLDGIDTGLKLNGFPGNLAIFTQTLIQDNPNNASALLAALQTDGQLIGSIIDSDPGDNAITLPFRIDTSLDITGTIDGGPGVIPLPAAALMGPLGAGLVGMFSRRFRGRAK
jgi:hypothetical protein